MAIPPYFEGYPPDGSSLGQTKSTIRNNLDGTFLTLGIDHINNNGQPGSRPAGYHNVIHSVPQGSDPAATTGYGQLYSKTINSVTTDEAMFWETGNGLIQQMTMNFTPQASQNGYTFLPGGIILQWAKFQTTDTSETISFATYGISFPTACFAVILQGADNTPANSNLLVIATTAAGFTTAQMNSNKFYYYFAIGN